MENTCIKNQCGPNAMCKDNICECIPDYFGNPYNECRPECVDNSDCLSDQACIRNKCQNPCIELCGFNAECTVIKHITMCICPAGMTGNPFSSCYELKSKLLKIAYKNYIQFIFYYY